MKNHTAEQKYAITLRVNRNLLEEIRKQAQLQDRTINSYMTALVRSMIQQDAKPAKKPK